jgi:nicotinamide phosphoribosyltransferase
MRQLLEQFGSGVCACVMDSYDYTNALEKVLPSVASFKVEKGGFLVLRPDSGDPIEVVLQALEAADKIFGSDTNVKGFKVLRGIGVIQGDGINITTLQDITKAVEKKGFAAQSVAYGMGGGLLQKVNRDTMSFATKLCYILYQDGTERHVMKMPKSDTSKTSLPGEFVVYRENGIPTVYPAETKHQGKNELDVVYDHGKVKEWDDFETVQVRAKTLWSQLPPLAQVISTELQQKRIMVAEKQRLANLNNE